MQTALDFPGSTAPGPVLLAFEVLSIPDIPAMIFTTEVPLILKKPLPHLKIRFNRQSTKIFTPFSAIVGICL